MSKITHSGELSCAMWLGRHERTVAHYAGQWIAVHPTRGIVAANKNLGVVEGTFRKQYPSMRPFLHRVPRRDERIFVL